LRIAFGVVSLDEQVIVLVKQRPGLTRDVPPGKESLLWVANSSTLISGKRDAVLVDTFLTIDQSNDLADWVAASGKNLTTIYVTHAHGDHFFGLKILLDRFPHAKAVAMPEVVKAMSRQTTPDSLENFWKARFPGQIPEPVVFPEVLQTNEIDLEAHALDFCADEFNAGHRTPSQTERLRVLRKSIACSATKPQSTVA